MAFVEWEMQRIEFGHCNCTEAEFASGKAKAQGAIALDFDRTRAHLVRFHWSTHGVVR
jgi:hypothetical protein